MLAWLAVIIHRLQPLVIPPERAIKAANLPLRCRPSLLTAVSCGLLYTISDHESYTLRVSALCRWVNSWEGKQLCVTIGGVDRGTGDQLAIYPGCSWYRSRLSRSVSTGTNVNMASYILLLHSLLDGLFCKA